MKNLKKLFVITLIIAIFSTAFVGCSKSSSKIQLGGQNVNEIVVLTHMAKLLIEDQTDYEVTINTEMSGSSVLHQAMLSEEIDLYPTWTGTQLTGVLRYEGENMSKEDTFDYVKNGFEEEFDMSWSKPFGFNNTYVFVVKEEVAKEYGLEKASDLADYAGEWTLAGDENFDTRADAYPGWSKAYDIEFDKVLEMQYGLIYRAIDAGEVEVAAAYATDSRIQKLGLKILEDDKEFFPDYSGAYVLSKNLIDNYPDVIEVIDQLSGKISNEQMVAMNYRFDNGDEPEAIAREFLSEIGLLK